MLVFSQSISRRFITNYLPEVIISQIISTVDKHKFDNMDLYLKSLGVNKTTIEILKFAVTHLDIKKVNGVYLVDVSPILKIGGYTIRQLVNLIDFGTTEVKGTLVYKEAERYINNNKAFIIDDYTKER